MSGRKSQAGPPENGGPSPARRAPSRGRARPQRGTRRRNSPQQQPEVKQVRQPSPNLNPNLPSPAGSSSSASTTTNQSLGSSTSTPQQPLPATTFTSGAANAPTSGAQQPAQQLPAERQEPVSNDYQLLLTPLFAAMTQITDHLFLTGVGGMTRDNFRRNHIDFVVNITTEAPFWDDIESMRVPLDDDVSANILPYLDVAVDRIHEAITKRNAHVLVHCVAGVSRSATIVIAYLMKIKRMDLRSAFNFCYSLRPVIRPNNGFMQQLINYEFQLFNRHSVYMTDVEVDGTTINVPSFFIDEHPKLVLLEVLRVKDQQKRLQREQQKSKGSSRDRRSSHSAADD